MVCLERGGWQSLQSACAQRWNRHAYTEDSIAEPGDDVIVGKAVDGVDEVGLPTEGFGAAGADADFQGEFDRAHRGRAARGVEVPCHRASEEHGGGAEQRRVHDLEVRVLEREGWLAGGGQRSEPQAGNSLRLAIGWPCPVTCGTRHGTRLSREVVAGDVGPPVLPRSVSRLRSDTCRCGLLAGSCHSQRSNRPLPSHIEDTWNCPDGERRTSQTNSLAFKRGRVLESIEAGRHPRGSGVGAPIEPGLDLVEIGKGVMRRRGRDVAFVAFGSLVAPALAAAEALDASVADMRFVKPLDVDLLRDLARSHRLLVTLEENAVAGGAGAGVAETLAELGIDVPVFHLGLPDRFIEHGDPVRMLADCGLDASGIERAVRQRITLLSE